MIFRRWEHGHSLAAGVLGGLLLATHVWTVAALAFGLGLAAGLALHALYQAGALLAERRRRLRRGLHGLRRDLARITPPPFDRERDPWSRTPW